MSHAGPAFLDVRNLLRVYRVTSRAAQESKLKKRVDLLVMDADIATKAAVCRWTTEPPVLDGKLDDPCWQHAAVIDKFASFWMEPPKSRPGTKAYLIWDDDALYYAGSMTDAELRSFGTKRNDHLWNGDVFELFLKPRLGAARVLRIPGQPSRRDF